MFARHLALIAAVLALPTAAFAQLPPASLPEGVAAGETTANSTLLWARSAVAGQVSFDLYADASLTTLVASQQVTVTDPNVPAKVSFSGLSSATPYFYKVTTPANESATGNLKTFAAPGQKTGLTFGVTGDWRGENAPFPAVKNVASKNLDFFVALGDTIYGDVSSKANNGQQQAQTVSEYRNKYQEVYGTNTDTVGNAANPFAAIRSSTTTFAMIDDHEVTNDFAGYATVASDPRFQYSNTNVAPSGTTRLNKTDLYTNGLTAFQDYHPIAATTYAVAGPDADRFNGVANLYRSRRLGSDAQLIVTDLRSFRDTPLPNPDLTVPANVPAQLAGFVATSLAATNRTLFGKTQLSQLKSDLLSAQTDGVTWKFINVGQAFQNLGPVGAGDRAEGYSAERTDLLKFIDDSKITNVVFIAADIHGSFINDLSYQTLGGTPTQTNPLGLIHKRTNAFEVSTGSVAYSPAAGPTLVSIAAAAGFVTPQELAFYNSQTGNPAVQEAFLQTLLLGQTDPFGYNPIGLADADALGTINVLEAVGYGGATAIPALANTVYTNTTTFGWTQFTIDPLTQNLTIDIYGIPGYPTGLSPDYTATNPVLMNHIVIAPIPEPTTLGLLALATPLITRRRR